jgi:hypothetical protein
VFQEWDIPSPGENQILVKTEACGVCHTDLHAAHGDWPVKPTLPAGGWGVIIPWVNLTVTGNGGRSQRAAGRKTASPPLPRTRKFCRSSSCWATTPVHGSLSGWIAEW